MKKILNIIKKIIIGIVVITFFGFAIVMTVLLLNYNKYGVTQMGDTTFVLIRERISSNNYKQGDLVFVKGTKLDEIKEGDEIFAYKVDKEGAVNIDLGTVESIHTKENAISYKNGATYGMDYVIGKADKVYNKIGTYLSIIESKWGFLFIVLVPSFLILIYEVYALVVEIKYGKEDAVN